MFCIPYKTYKYSTGDLFKRKEITRAFCPFLLVSSDLKNQIGGFVQSMYSKMLMLFLTLTMSACNSGGGANETPQLDSEFKCVPQSSLQGIVGGQVVGKYDTDANKVVMLLSGSGRKVELCTAAPIAPDVLLTAAHCIVATADQTRAFVTTSATCESGFNRLEQGIQVASIVVHENYSDIENLPLNTPNKSDLALVFLKKSLPKEFPIYKIAKPAKSEELGTLYFFGYGAVSLNKRSSGILRKTEVSPWAYNVDLHLQEVSVDQRYGHGVCSGDSGGPGLVMLNGELQILGVNSYVSGSGDTDYCMNRGNLALVDYYSPWIENKMAARGRTLRK